MAESSLLFLGYRIADWDFHVLLQILSEYLEKSKIVHHSVQLVPGDVFVSRNFTEAQKEKAKNYLDHYFDKRDIQVYLQSCRDFAKELKKRWEASYITTPPTTPEETPPSTPNSGRNGGEPENISILFLAACPIGEYRLRLDEEFREIYGKLKSSKHRDKFRLEPPQLAVRSDDLLQALFDAQPQIVHFSGHGTPTGALCFEDQEGKSHFVEPDALAALFEQFSGQVECVVLNACYSEIQATAIAKHIKYVIGMNQEIGDEAANDFTIGFYQALGVGYSIEDAYKLGRIQIQLQNIPEHLTPVLIKKEHERRLPIVGPEFQAYVGPRPFEENDKAIFFGRDREVRDLLFTVIAHNLVLVYAQSGAGKTSLIKAGLVPLLKEKRFEVLPLARVKGTILENIRTDEISNIYVFNTLTSWVKKGEYDVKRLAKMKLVDFLNEQKRMLDEDGTPLPRVVIFDQFEEIFSLYQDHLKDREGFFEQVNDALEADPLLRVVFVIREDFIAQLDPYEDPLPERMWTHFHLERLRREAALDAIKEPVEKAGRSFAKGVAEKLVDDLLTIQVETMPGKTVEVPGEFIEAVQLQIVCQNLWKKLPPDEKQITHQHRETYGNVEKVLYKFYEEAIRAAAEKAGIDEEGLRKLCGEVLITKMGTRGMVYQDQESTGGVPNAAIKILEDKHLIRAESRAGARWYELTHDSFIKPIQSSNKVFNDKLAEEEMAEREREAEKKGAEEVRKRIRNLIIKGVKRLAAFSVIIILLLKFVLKEILHLL